MMCGVATTLAVPDWFLRTRTAHADIAVDPTVGRTLAFEDSFSTLDTNIWWAGPKVGSSDPGFYGRAAFARLGGEAGFDPYAIVDDPEANGGTALRISAKYIGKPMNVPNYYGNKRPEFEWVSGNIQTAKPDGTILKGWRRGYFEARMRFPKHPLTWPGFWMLNSNCIRNPKACVEIDVVEHKGFELELYGAYLHEWGQPGEHGDGVGVPTKVDLTQGYHLYGMLLDGDRCIPYFDRQPVPDTQTGRPISWTMGRSAQLDERGDVFWPLLTLALLPDYPYPNPLLPEHELAHMFVDYMRVYS